jgi:hypothetical protein
MSIMETYWACAGAIFIVIGGLGTWSAVAAAKEKNAAKGGASNPRQ